jgi:hypothetical protein
MVVLVILLSEIGGTDYGILSHKSQATLEKNYS